MSDAVPHVSETVYVLRRSLAVCILLALPPLLFLVVAQGSNPSIADRFVALANASRSDAGLPAYRVAADLGEVAAGQGERMATQENIFHNPNLLTEVSDWHRVGENVGVGESPEQVHAAFMDSPSHRQIILDDYYTEMGVGTAVGANGRLYVSEVFRLRPGEPPQPPAPATDQPAAEQPTAEPPTTPATTAAPITTPTTTAAPATTAAPITTAAPATTPATTAAPATTPATTAAPAVVLPPALEAPPTTIAEPPLTTIVTSSKTTPGGTAAVAAADAGSSPPAHNEGPAALVGATVAACVLTALGFALAH